MIVMVAMSDTFIDADKIYEDQIIKHIMMSQIDYPRNWSNSVVRFLSWYKYSRRGFVKKNGAYFAKNKHDIETYIIEADDLNGAVATAFKLYDELEMK